ncbi:MAG: hypothetical protein HOL04_09985 [Gammaproteobacteria bacterium]|nr:hypothetical protein [Gammaproteobacteria bacterium]MBT4607056.1 hypothetical protein [Thiotrichales bacterium]MBT4081690.1 hypothetical protein [Gammaproteobacteria bacterium]MBT4331278.1 hypothetical protein [Gammaproteobacteria bacterium]MBT4811380.1 hypothetical protein [Thiotrichales bacterium]
MDDPHMITTRFPHLQAMGIQQWVRRELSLEESVEPVESAIAEPSIEHYATQVQWQPAAGANLLLITPPLEGAAEQLLGAMLLSIGIPVAGCYRGTVLESSLLTEGEGTFPSYLQQQFEQSGAQMILQLGGDSLSLPNLIHSFDPAHLLKKPADKRAAWEALKQLHSQLVVPSPKQGEG